MPVVLMIDADSVEDAKTAIEDWCNEIDLNDDLPAGTEDIDISPNCDYNDEGQRILYLPTIEEGDNLSDDEDEDEDDDFQDGELDFS